MAFNIFDPFGVKARRDERAAIELEQYKQRRDADIQRRRRRDEADKIRKVAASKAYDESRTYQNRDSSLDYVTSPIVMNSFD